MSLLDRLGVNVAPEDTDTISANAFYASLVGLREGIFTRAQIESRFNIGTSGTDKAEMDFIINSFNVALNKERWFLSLHAALLATSDNNIDYNPTKAQLQDWLTAAEV